MSSQINTSESILTINENNDKTQNLGDEATLIEQSENGIDLLNVRSTAYSVFEFFEQMFPMNYRNEMSDYVNAPTEESKHAVLDEYDEEKHIVNQPTKEYIIVEEKHEKKRPSANYELMYKDRVCTFFIGSVSIISLYAVFKIIERK
jgi:hypothetical protein